MTAGRDPHVDVMLRDNGSARRLRSDSRVTLLDAPRDELADELQQLAEEQSALRRIATLVARGEPPSGVFVAVVTEVCRLLGADITTLFRYEPGDTA